MIWFLVSCFLFDENLISFFIFFRDMSWKFKVLQGNYYWICGAVPLETKEYLGEFSEERPSPLISLENDISAAVRTPEFDARGENPFELNMHQEDIEVVFCRQSKFENHS